MLRSGLVLAGANSWLSGIATSAVLQWTLQLAFSRGFDKTLKCNNDSRVDLINRT
jgi:hypothetical protein